MIRRYAYALVLAAVVVVSMLCLCGGYAWYEDRCQQAGGHLHVGLPGRAVVHHRRWPGDRAVKVWVVLCTEDVTIIGVAATADLAKALAETDNEGPLTWRQRPNGALIAGEIDYPDYRVKPCEVIEP